jgi:hypothetical protein
MAITAKARAGTQNTFFMHFTSFDLIITKTNGKLLYQTTPDLQA